MLYSETAGDWHHKATGQVFIDVIAYESYEGSFPLGQSPTRSKCTPHLHNHFHLKSPQWTSGC